MIPSLFGSLNRSIRGMQYAQTSLAAHSKNISNANDPHYTRQVPLTPSQGDPVGPGVARYRDAFVDEQYRLYSSNQGNHEARREVISKIEDIFGDPVDGGLRTAMDSFFDTWQALGENPADGVNRVRVLAAGETLVQQIRSAYDSLTAVQNTINDQLAVKVAEVNAAIDRVYEANNQIMALKRNNLNEADLRDQRDYALDQLAKLVGAKAYENGDGTVRVVVGSTPLIDPPTKIHLKLQDTPDGPSPVWDSQYVPDFTGKGTIGGLISARDGEAKRLKTEIDSLGKTVANQVNAVHRTGKGTDGVDNRDFFLVGGNPVDIILNPNLQPHMIAAGKTTGLPGDGDNARAIAALADKPVLNSTIIPGQTQSVRTFYRTLVGWIGARGEDAILNEDIAKSSVQIAEQHRQSTHGVSLDEEMAALTMQQKAFAASARAISVLDGMLEELVNIIG